LLKRQDEGIDLEFNIFLVYIDFCFLVQSDMNIYFISSIIIFYKKNQSLV
jgi:hypothetical protein